MSILRYEEQAAHIYDELKKTPRTGWVMRGVPNPETVYDHTVSLVTLANQLQDDLRFSDAKITELTFILEVHDWAEAIVGDEVILDENPEDYAAKKAIKHEQEKQAMTEICRNLECGESAYAAWERYESGADDVAKFAKELDKYQAVELALDYERKYGIKLFEEFDTYSKKHINHPALVARLENLRERHSNL